MNRFPGNKGFRLAFGVMRQRSQRGAALLIVLAIIGLGASIMLLNAVTGIRPDMKDDIAASGQLRRAREALVGFAMIHGRLPCPARPETASGTSNSGIPAGMEDCPRIFGVLPWASLGLPEVDNRGRRYSYRVTTDFTSTFNATTTGDITILDTAGGSIIADQLPAVLVCHGGNGFHAWLPSGTQMPASTDADETDNDPADTNFVSKAHSETFDDLVIWIEPAALVDMMTKAGKL
jgi:type II secretory pathway pseudopilin PulG